MGNLKFDKKDIEIVEGDLSSFEDCKKALEGIEIAYYLVHSMEGYAKDWRNFWIKKKILLKPLAVHVTNVTLKE